jgi:hypothetical protein
VRRPAISIFFYFRRRRTSVAMASAPFPSVCLVDVSNHCNLLYWVTVRFRNRLELGLPAEPGSSEPFATRSPLYDPSAKPGDDDQKDDRPADQKTLHLAHRYPPLNLSQHVGEASDRRFLRGRVVILRRRSNWIDCDIFADRRCPLLSARFDTHPGSARSSLEDRLKRLPAHISSSARGAKAHIVDRSGLLLIPDERVRLRS